MKTTFVKQTQELLYLLFSVLKCSLVTNNNSLSLVYLNK